MTDSSSAASSRSMVRVALKTIRYTRTPPKKMRLAAPTMPACTTGMGYRNASRATATAAQAVGICHSLARLTIRSRCSRRSGSRADLAHERLRGTEIKQPLADERIPKISEYSPNVDLPNAARSRRPPPAGSTRSRCDPPPAPWYFSGRSSEARSQYASRSSPRSSRSRW